MENQQKYNEMCSLAEEIDFQGLMEYIRNNLVEQASVRIFNPNKKKRGDTRREIVNAAVSFSKATTPEEKQRVSKYVYTCLDIIREFYKTHHLSVKEYILAEMIGDAIAEEIHDATATTVASVNSATDRILKKLDDNGSFFSIDKVAALVENGKTDVVGGGIKKMIDHISLEHPCYPDFGFDYMDGELISKPLTPRLLCFILPELYLLAQ